MAAYQYSRLERADTLPHVQRDRYKSLFEHSGITVNASAAKNAVTKLDHFFDTQGLRWGSEAAKIAVVSYENHQRETSPAKVHDQTHDAAKLDSDVGRALAALGLPQGLSTEIGESYVREIQFEKVIPQVQQVPSKLPKNADLKTEPRQQIDEQPDSMQVLSKTEDSQHGTASWQLDGRELKPDPCQPMNLWTPETALELPGRMQVPSKTEGRQPGATSWQRDDDAVAGVVPPEANRIDLDSSAWLCRTSTASLGSRVLLQGSDVAKPPRHCAEEDPASADCPLAAMYGPGAARSRRLGEIRRARPWSLRKAMASLSSSMHSSPSARVQRQEQPCAEAEVPDQQEPLPDIAALDEPSSAPSQPPASGLPRKSADPANAAVMIALKCGHRLALAAELVSGAGFAKQGTLICPSCGEQAVASQDGLKAYSSSADTYVGELRKDYQVPLRVPQPPPRAAVEWQLGGVLTGELASSFAATSPRLTSAPSTMWTLDTFRSRSGLVCKGGSMSPRSSRAVPRTTPQGSRQRTMHGTKPNRSAAASVLSCSPRPPNTAPAKLRSALGSL